MKVSRIRILEKNNYVYDVYVVFMMKKKLIYISIILIAFIFWGILKRQNQNNDSFLWCDAYIAAEEESDYTISLTYVYINQPIDFAKVCSIEFVNASNVYVESFEFYNMENTMKYKSIGIDLKLHFSKMSFLKCNTIKVMFEDGKTKLYKVGDWEFDIGEKESNMQILNIWESPVASANHSEFPYCYIPSSQIRIMKIQYTNGQMAHINVNGRDEISGKLSLDNRAPVVLIRPRILCEIDNETVVCYGNSCYCGALNVNEEDINKSYNYLND